MECIPLWPGRTLGKTYEIKLRCYWEHPWGTHWEPSEFEGNTGTKEKRKEKILTLNPPHHPHNTPQKKKKTNKITKCQPKPPPKHHH